MRYTNKHNYPDVIVNILAKDSYIRGDNDYSVTELIEAPQIVQLKRRHWDDLVEDVSDNIWSIFGSAVHNVMESHASDGDFVEQRYYIERFGRKIGGMIDAFTDGVLSDYKVTSAWSIVYGSRLPHWTQQCNLYAHLLRENGIDVHRAQIVTFLRDWDRNKAKADYTYPQAPLLVLPIPLWESEACEEYIEQRLQWHILNEDLPDIALQHCTSEDVWEQPTKFACMKKDAKRATRVFDDEEEANAYVKANKGLEVTTRPGKRTRCEDYCSLAPFCQQFQNYKAEQTLV